MRRGTACALALLCLAAGCAEGRQAVPERGDGLLFAYEAGNHLHQYGGRVFGDGRYEMYSTSDTRGTPPWTAHEGFASEQVDEIAAEVDRALDAGIPDRISAGDPPPSDAVTAHLTLRDREIRVGDWPRNAPAELRRVLDKIDDLRRRAPVPSTWELWSRGAVVKLEVGCDVGEVDALRDLRDALFMTGAAAPGGPPAGDDPPDGTALARVTFSAPGGDEVLEVFADGRRVERAASGEPREQRLEDGRLDAVRRALAATDWAALPSRLC